MRPHGFNDMASGKDVHETWAGPIDTTMYGEGLQALCTKTQANLNRLSHHMEKTDPCLEYGMKHWHPGHRPSSAGPRIQSTKSNARWENLDVMFTDYDSTRKLSSTINEGTGEYVDPPVPVNRFCYLCSTMEEHKKHMLQHKPPKRPSSAKPRVMYIAPMPKVRKKKEEEPEILIKERLYKVEVFTSDRSNAGTSANVYITIKGSLELLPRTQLVKKRGCASFCFVRASKEVFHVTGPLLGNLQTLTIEHDGRKKFHGWHLEKIEVTDVKAMKTWVFHCEEWLSLFEKPHYTNVMDLTAEEKNMPLAEYHIEVYTGKKKMAGTDANVYMMMYGEHGSSKKVHLMDNTKDKKLFERNSVDNFKIRMNSLGNLTRIRIEHDGKGMGAGWFLDRIIIKDSARPKDIFYFLYNGWIAKDEGEGKLWREIRAKKVLPKEVHEGEKTRYNISLKTSDIRYAGTDANVFIQIAGVQKGITPKLKLDDAKNNFERNMVDNFEIDAVNVGVIDHIIVGHDNFGPGAGWHLEHVTIRRYVPKSEAKERVKKVKKKLKKEKKLKNQKGRFDQDLESDDDDYETDRNKRYRSKEKSKTSKSRSDSKSPDLFYVTSESEAGTDEESEVLRKSRGRNDVKSKRPGSALRRQSSHTSDRNGSMVDRSDKRWSGSPDRGRSPTDRSDRRGSPFNRSDRRSSTSDKSDNRHRSGSMSSTGRPSSALSQSASERRVSTSASSLRKQEEKENRESKKGKKGYDADEQLEDTRVALYEEYMFVCNKWFAADEDDGLYVRELPVTNKTVYYKQ